MPTVITNYNSPENFATVFIYINDGTAGSEIALLNAEAQTAGDEFNNMVPRYLASQQSLLGSWGLRVDGLLNEKNTIYTSSDIVKSNAVNGGHYTPGDLIDSKKYRKTTITQVPENSTIIGAVIAGSGSGIQQGIANDETTAWLVSYSGGVPQTKIIWFGEIIYEGPLNQNDPQTNNGLDSPYGTWTYTDPNTGNVYTRGPAQFTNSSGFFVHKIGRKEPDQIVTTTVDVTTNKDTEYFFYDVIFTSETEIDNYLASAALIIPVHILQRTISQRGVNWSPEGLNLKDSFIRVAPDMSSAQAEVLDLYDTYGIEAFAIPITLNIGGNAVKLGLNQLVDVNNNNPAAGEVITYTGAHWENTALQPVALSGSYYDLVDEPPVPQISTLTDVIITNDGTSANTLANGNILQWNNTLSVWENVAGISSTSILDFDTTGSATGDVLQRDPSGVYQSAPLSSDTVVEGTNNLYFSEQRARESFTTTFNKLHMDYDLLSDSTNNVAISSVQSIVMFLDTNNNEDGNYFGLFNNEDETTTALSKESAIFRVEENGDIYSDGNLSVDGEIIGSSIGNSTNYATSQGWQAGAAGTFSLQTGYYGGDFINNGSQAENSVIWGPSPFGGRSLLWQTIGGSDLAHDADGGWNKSIGNLPSSQDHAYLSYVYVKRTSSTTGGLFYHGCGDCLNSDGTVNDNAYFVHTVIGSLPQDVWCVSIGIILAHSDAVNVPTPDMVGFYRLDTGAKILSSSVFRSKSLGPTDDISYGAVGPEMQVHRTYHYYSTDATSALAFAKPGFHVIDGTEPSLSTLLS
jgi:hypothetical protein